MRSIRFLQTAILVASSLLGLGAFLYPFFLPASTLAAAQGAMAHAADAPLVFVLLLLFCLAAAFAALGNEEMTSKGTALLGILTALSAALRAVPGPAGFQAIFLLPILSGYCYGPAFGFLLGALSLLVSALIGGGVGPWLPYQMFATGWVGLVSGWLPELGRGRRWEPVMLAAWGALAGLLFGALMNLWFWPYLAPTGAAAAGPFLTEVAGGEGWKPGMSVVQGLRSYAAFYVATSLWWDAARAAGNAALLLLFARPVLRVLRRYRSRFQFELVTHFQ